TSVRWEQFDKPYLIKAFKAAKISARVVNAQGDPQKQKTQADQCISDGAKVLIIAPNDSASAAAIEKAAAKLGVKSIDYDRQVEGGVAVLYASFNGHTVGVLQGTVVANALKGKHGAVVVANDGMANAAIVALKTHKLKPIPMSGQDATTQGVQNIISGWQTMTVFKDVRKLATATAGAAIKIVKGQKPPTTGFVTTKG